jgi:hypothetical protein
VHDPVEGCVVDPAEHLGLEGLAGDAGVVDQDVDRLIAVLRRQGVDLLLVRHV